MPRRSGALALLLLFCPSLTNASLESRDLLAAGDGLVTYDSDTGFEWLDLTPTTGLSLQDLVTGAGGWYDLGFAHASATEVQSLWEHAGITRMDGFFWEENFAGFCTLVAFMGRTFLRFETFDNVRALTAEGSFHEMEGSCCCSGVARAKLNVGSRGCTDVDSQMSHYMRRHGNLPDCAAGFLDETPDSLRQLAGSNGVAWGDYDSDTWIDFVVSRSNSNPFDPLPGGRLFHQIEETAENRAFGMDVSRWSLRGFRCRTAVWGDYDADHDVDLFVTSVGGADSLFVNDGAGHLSGGDCIALSAPGPNYGASWADCDGDGWLDLYVANYGVHADRLFHNDGEGCFVDSPCGLSLDAVEGHGGAWGDYDNDGDLDLFVAQDSPPWVSLYRNRGNCCFEDVSFMLQVRLQGHGGAWGDYDNDGDLDLCYTRGSGNVSAVLLRNDGAAFVDVPCEPFSAEFGTGVAWGDFDNDGYLDLFLTDNTPPHTLLLNDGEGCFVDSSHLLPFNGVPARGTALADYDGDGQLDIAYVGVEGGRVWQNAFPTGNHWLEVNLFDPFGAYSAIGARVVVVAGGTRQIREISGGAGLFSQDSPVLHFGLGTASSVDSLILSWPGWPDGPPAPDRFTRVLTNVAVDQFLTVTMNIADVASNSLSPSSSLSVASNPLSSNSVVSWRIDRPSHVRLSAFDASGRRRAIVFEGESSVAQSHVWHGVDDSGRRLPSGVYLLRLESGTWAASASVTITR